MSIQSPSQISALLSGFSRFGDLSVNREQRLEDLERLTRVTQGEQDLAGLHTAARAAHWMLSGSPGRGLEPHLLQAILRGERRLLRHFNNNSPGRLSQDTSVPDSEQTQRESSEPPPWKTPPYQWAAFSPETREALIKMVEPYGDLVDLKRDTEQHAEFLRRCIMEATKDYELGLNRLRDFFVLLASERMNGTRLGHSFWDRWTPHMAAHVRAFLRDLEIRALETGPGEEVKASIDLIWRALNESGFGAGKHGSRRRAGLAAMIRGRSRAGNELMKGSDDWQAPWPRTTIQTISLNGPEDVQMEAAEQELARMFGGNNQRIPLRRALSFFLPQDGSVLKNFEVRQDTEGTIHILEDLHADGRLVERFVFQIPSPPHGPSSSWIVSAHISSLRDFQRSGPIPQILRKLFPLLAKVGVTQFTVRRVGEGLSLFSWLGFQIPAQVLGELKEDLKGWLKARGIRFEASEVDGLKNAWDLDALMVAGRPVGREFLLEFSRKRIIWRDVYFSLDFNYPGWDLLNKE